MGITTTTSIHVPKPSGPCVRCGWFGGLFVKTAQGLLRHFDDCSLDVPLGEPPADPYTAIAHDPMGDVQHDAMGRQLSPHADLRALELLKEHGVGQTLRPPRPSGLGVHERLGGGGGEWTGGELDTAALRRRMEGGDLQQVAGGPVLGPAIGETRYGSQGKPKPIE